MMQRNELDITLVIPQRPPFVMVDELVQDDAVITRTRFRVKDGQLFLEQGRLEAAALVENIAQTAAAGVGYKALQSNQPVQIGFIGAIRNLVVHELPVTGDLLETETKLVNTVFNVSVVEGTVSANGRLLATCEMKIFLQS